MYNNYYIKKIFLFTIWKIYNHIYTFTIALHVFHIFVLQRYSLFIQKETVYFCILPRIAMNSNNRLSAAARGRRLLKKYDSQINLKGCCGINRFIRD